KPFFWLADTAWEIFHSLSYENAELYLKTRSQQGFNVIQTVILSEFDGLNVPNHYGRVPLKKNEKGEFDPTLPDTEGDYSFFHHTDKVITLAESYGIYVALLPTWGDKYNQKWGAGPEIFTPDNAFAYGKWLGERYKNNNNIIWVLGGDRPLEEPVHYEINEKLALGLKAGGADQLITFHPMGGRSSTEHLHNEDWLDFNMIQSGHGRAITINHEMIKADYGLSPVKPVIEAECCYEDHSISFQPQNGYFDATDVRRASYWAVLSGSAGITYGHHSIWAFKNDPTEDSRFAYPYFIKSWQEALTSPCASQMKHLKSLFESVDYQNGVPDNSVLAVNFQGANHQAVFKGEHFVFVYCPHGLQTTLKKDSIHPDCTCKWFDPRTGKSQPAEYCIGDNYVFYPPSHGRNCDSVLIIEQ
ncbi:MAG: hypothetical protein BGN88_06900, partial [Clostridiales bacterium 43-6]